MRTSALHQSVSGLASGIDLIFLDPSRVSCFLSIPRLTPRHSEKLTLVSFLAHLSVYTAVRGISFPGAITYK